MLFSVTEINTFKRCKRQWDLHNRQNLNPIVSAPALTLGTLIHAAHARWLMEPNLTLPGLYLDEAAKYILNIDEYYRRKFNSSLNDKEQDDLAKTVKLGFAMCDNYQEVWKTPIPKIMKVLAPEQSITVEIPGSFDTTGEQNYLQGRLDALLTDQQNSIYVMEHKTYTNLPSDETLSMNDQFTGYIWLASQLNLGDVEGIAYDGLRKLDKAPKGGPKEDLFHRVLLRRNNYQIVDYVEDLVETTIEMSRQPEILKQRNRRWEGCYDCSYLKICKAMSNGDDVDSVIKNYYTRSTELDEVQE